MKRRVYPIDAPPDATQRQRQQFRQNVKRADRAARGRCRYCGKLPETGRLICERCLALRRKQAANARERERLKRDAAQRAAQPRTCPKCSGADLQQREVRHGRPYFKCRTCGRSSFGDGPSAPPPDYPCPYCGARCVKNGRVLVTPRKPQRYLCTVCGRTNLNLWPEDTPSPGGPFPHQFFFGLNVPAHEALLVYCQKKKMSIPQAIRDIFIRAAAVPPARTASVHNGYHFQSPAIRAYLAGSPKTSLPTIPTGGLRLPSAFPAALEKLNWHRVRGHYSPSVLVTLKFSVRLNDLALASLIEMMRRRRLNHQDAARALIAETQQPARKPTLIAIPRNDLDDGW